MLREHSEVSSTLDISGRIQKDPERPGSAFCVIPLLFLPQALVLGLLQLINLLTDGFWL